jgi:DNA repair exonuclease SbcCD ATPase subunit
MINGHREAIQNLNDEILTSAEVHGEELQSLSDQLANQAIGLQQQFEDAKQATAEAIQQFAKDFEDSQSRYKSTFSSMGDAIQQLAERHRLEMDRLQKRHKDAAQESAAKIEQAHCECLVAQDNQMQSRATVLDDLAQTKSQNELKINGLSSEQGQKLKGIADEFNEQLQALQDEIDACLKGGSQETKRNRELLQRLLNEKESVLADYTNMVSGYDASHGEQTTSLNAQNEREIEELRTKNRSEADRQITADDSECASLQEELDAEYARQQAELSQAYESTITSVNGLRQERSEIEEIIATFGKAYQKEQDELDAMIPPDVDGNQLFAKFDASTETLGSQKVELLQLIELQKRSLRAEWDARFGAENDRHALHVVRSSAGTEREQGRLALLQEISDVEPSQKDEERDLEDLLNQVNQEHLRMIDHFKEKLSSARSSQEAERLKVDKEHLRSIYFDQIEQQKQMTHKYEVRAQERIVTESRASAQRITEVSERIDSARSEFKAQKLRFDSQSAASTSQFNQSYSQIGSNAETRTRQICEAHLTQMSGIAKEFEMLKEQLLRTGTSFLKKMKDNRSQCQSSLDEYARVGQCDSEKRAREWREMVKFFDEKIMMLTRRKNDAMLAFQQRPARQSEIEIIEQLEGLLHTKTMQLQNALRDSQEYRSLRQRQESDASHRFGKPPKVGVLPLSVKTVH